MRLKDEVAVITGASQGLGKQYALRFAEEGAKVVIAELNLEAAKATAAEISAKGSEALALCTDVSSEDSTLEMAKRTVERFKKIDILVNNAAIYYGLGFKPFNAISVEEWDRVMAVNVKGSWLCIKAVCPQMAAQRKGKIINISSTVHFLGTPYFVHYVASKSAVIGVTRALANELGEYGININSVAPGLVMTEASKTMPGSPPGLAESVADMQAFKRNLQPEDVVGTVVFLASDDSDFLTGQTIAVNGGLAMH